MNEIVEKIGMYAVIVVLIIVSILQQIQINTLKEFKADRVVDMTVVKDENITKDLNKKEGK